MKKLMLLALFVFAGLLYTNKTEAQLSISVNIGDQPAWAPVDNDAAQYYYIPDMDVYYDVPTHQFLYLQNKHWLRSSVLPPRYGHFDLYRVHKVAINQPDAYKNHRRDKVQYAQFKGKYDQTPIRDSHAEKYNNNRNNWQNNRFNKGGHDNGHGNTHNDHDNRGN